jgi:hypothetical protein
MNLESKGLINFTNRFTQIPESAIGWDFIRVRSHA